MLCDCFKSRRQLEAEILVLRHRLNVLRQRAPRRLHLRWADRALFIWLYRRCPRILDAITIVRPETVVRWQRTGFAAYWRWKSRPLGGRPQIGKEVRDLIRRMSFENRLWGALQDPWRVAHPPPCLVTQAIHNGLSQRPSSSSQSDVVPTMVGPPKADHS